MPWDDGFVQKDSKNSPGKAGSNQEMEQEHPKKQGEVQGRYWDRQDNKQGYL